VRATARVCAERTRAVVRARDGVRANSARSNRVACGRPRSHNTSPATCGWVQNLMVCERASYAYGVVVQTRTRKAYAPLVRVRSRAREGACAVTNTHVQVPHVSTRSTHVSSSLYAYSRTRARARVPRRRTFTAATRRVEIVSFGRCAGCVA